MKYTIQIDLIFNTEFTNDNPQQTEFYKEWAELTKQNKMPEFEVCRNRIVFLSFDGVKS